MRSGSRAARLFRVVGEILLSLVASLIIALMVPWQHVLSASIPSGGDNPAHPVLMMSIGEAFFEHLKLIHYSYYFWGGFEAFQFYFPLPYLAGAALARVIEPNIAYKLVTLFGIIGLPFAFYWMAASIRLAVPSRLLASLLAIPFLYTEAHVMWGGNVFSALAGMIGNQWGFFFFVLAFGQILRASLTGRFSFSALAFSLLASLSHFYCFLMLFMLYSALLLQDLGWAAWNRTRPRLLWGTYSIGVCAGLLMAWWALPLKAYQYMSSDLGGDWDITLLTTFTVAERVFFGAAIFVSMLMVIRERGMTRKLIVTGFAFLALYLALYSINDIFGTTAFIRIRLWPSIYFGLYFMVILAADRIFRIAPKPVFAAIAACCYFLIPQPAAFNNAKAWMEWNYTGLQSRPAWQDMDAVFRYLRSEPASRVSYESADEANGTLGSVRTPELIPYLTPHEIILGGIVNSASYAGIGYMLHCLDSESCAGWPPGSVMPEKDLPRAIELMRALGIRYHLAITKINRDLFDQQQGLKKVFSGNHLSLYKLDGEISMVEAYDSELPVLCSKRAITSLLNAPRWDALRNAGVIYDKDCSMSEADSARLLNFLVDEWHSKRRVLDRGWKDRPDRINNKLSAFLFAYRSEFGEKRALTTDFEPFVADRVFDPHQLATNTQEGYSEVAAPLLRALPGSGPVRIMGRGYRAYSDGREIPFNQTSEVEFKETSIGGSKAPFAWIVFKPIRSEKFRSVEMFSDDPTILSGLPGGKLASLPKRVTPDCAPVLEKRFHELTLKTKCPGKPHVIKYSYFPKWNANGVEIRQASNGFMALTPRSEVTVISHRRSAIDWIGILISLVTAAGLAVYAFRRFFLKSTVLQA